MVTLAQPEQLALRFDVREPTRARARARVNRWLNKSRQQYASERRERLVLLLSSWDVQAHIGQQIVRGEVPETVPGPGYARCARCRRTCTADLLEIDHVDGCTWNKRSVNAWRRVARYWRELVEGVRLRVLCRSCNGSDGYRFRRRVS